MKKEELDKAVYLQGAINYLQRDARWFKELRARIIDDKNEKQVIEDAWKEFHLFSFTDEWSVELRAKIIKLMLQTIDERLESIGKELIEVEKQFEQL